MRPWISRHLGTLVVGGILLVALMASSATAALVITGKDIKNGSVTTKDVKDGSLKSADLSKKTRSDLGGTPFIGSACHIPGGDDGTVAMHLDAQGVITLSCRTAPVSGLDTDADGDGFQKSQECNDLAASVNPSAPEVFANHVDDDCDTVADDGHDTSDFDGDGQSILQGDCDDVRTQTKSGGPDPFGDGLDNNCDGVDGIA